MLRKFAERLIEHEAKGNKSAGSKKITAFPVCEKLRPHLATLMGNVGFRALLARSLVLAGAEVPWLRTVQVRADGSLEDPAGLAAQTDKREIAKGRIVLLTQLFGLLVAFIGEKLTLRLVHEIWPKLPPPPRKKSKV